ncbi:MAG TPA: M36 family metallopeptidase [Verrucomicrobiae bacterium]|nr:M36 family metallopeptidase [Verrucomicrobiae bacterium]
MKGQILRLEAILFLLLLSSAGVVAFQEPSGGNRLSDLDARIGARAGAVTPSAQQDAALARLQAQLPRVEVAFDEVTVAPRSVSRLDGFLTPASSSAPASPPGTAAALPIIDTNQPIKTFLDEYRDLFGHGSEALNQTRVVRDYITAHNGMRTVAWQQEVDGIPVSEGVLVAHLTRLGELINISSGFVPEPETAASVSTSTRAELAAAPPISGATAVLRAAQNLGETLEQNEVELSEEAVGVEKKQHFRAPQIRGQASASLAWVPLNREELRLCWDVLLTSRLRGEMFRLFVDAQSGEVLIRRSLTRYISDASYRVYTSDSPSPFSPGHATLLTNQPPLTNRLLVTLPALFTNASPNGWINDGINETIGNNVDAHADRNDDDLPDLPRPAGSPFRVFDFAMNPSTQDPTNYIPAAVTQLFYLCNWYHDRLYALGFTEAAGNFQVNNFGRGGVGNDPVLADAQDGGGFNNANFGTPPDGSSGRMQMYIFSGPNPRRDGDFDAEIVFHEYTHGLSWRLVGGGQGLGTSQSDGMGEGWSDFYGLALLSEPGDDVNGCYAAGGYATYLLSGLTTNYYFGIRRYPYSTDLTKNPLTFKDIDTQLASPHTGIPRSPIIGNSANEVHNQGEVWCVALWEARANLVNKYGWAVGNQLILQLVTDGMKLSPPAPNFLQARNAILQADLVNSGGANRAALWSAFAKRGMGYSATSPSSSSNLGIVEAYDVPDDLVVNPMTMLTSSGPVGGPFTPNPGQFVLTNAGSTNLSWSLLNTSTWITVQPTSGTLSPGGPGVTVTVTVGAVANTFALGTYPAGLIFSNHTSGMSQPRTFRLSVVGGSMFDDFEPTLDLSQWSTFGGIVGSTILATNYGGSISAPNSLWFGASESRFATTMPIDTSGGGSISYWLRLGDGSFPWETVDVPGEGIVLEYSVNGGSSWTVIATHNTTAFYNWTSVSNAIPVGARSSSALFRWRQLSHSGSGFDHWALDDVMVDAAPAATLTLSIPTTATEGNSPLSGMVSAFPVTPSNLTVNLSSSDPSQVAVPASVIISAGSSNATFDVTIQNDSDLDGTQTATITASASAHQGASALIAVADDETAVMTVAVPAEVSESSGLVSGTINVSAAPTANIVIGLASSDTSEIQVPASVVLLAGQTSASFDMTVVNDNLIDGPQSVTITAHVPNWTDGVGNLTVLDNEVLNLSVVLPASAYENAGVLSGAGSVAIAGTLSTNLTVSLQSSDLSEATVPGSVTIVAGQTSRAFAITMIDDLVVDGGQTLLVTASAPGFITGSNAMTVLDDESPPSPTNPLPADLASNVIANTSLSWSNGLAGVTNDVYLGTAAGQLVLVGSTTGTSMALPLLAPNTTYYWRVVVRRVGSTMGPVWQFATRSADHFVWDAITPPKYVSQPFNVKLTAKDEFQTTVSNFNGVVNLTGVNAGLVTNRIIGDVVHSNTDTGNYTLAFAITPNTNLTVTHVRSYSGTKVSIWSNTGTLLVSQSVSGPNGTWTETPLPVPFQLIAGTTYRVSFYTAGSSYYYRQDRPSTFPNGTLVDGYYYASGDTFPTSFYSSDKVIFLCDLRYTVSGLEATPISPTVAGPFVNGAWSGDLSVLAPTTNVVLRADDGSGHSGTSNPFDVLLQNDIEVSLTDSPDPVSIGGNVTYAISVYNTGPAPASGVTVTNLLPAGTSLVSVSPSQGTTATNGSTVVCGLGSVAANTTATVIIVATANGAGILTNRVTVSRSDADAYPGNNSAQTTTAVQLPAITISDASVFEGNAGNGTAAFTVTVNPPPAVPVSVSFSTLSGSAVSPGDFLSTNGVLNFAIGQSSRTLPVTIVGDAAYELDETFTVNLSGPINASLADGQAFGTIRNDDPIPTLSIGDVYLREGNGGITNAVFPVTLSAASSLGVTVSYNTINGNAVSGSDYIAQSGSFSIPAGTTTNQVTIPVNGDLQIEPDEVYYVDLLSPANAVLLKREGVGLIVNDDGLPGEVDHFVWGALAPTQYVGAPFSATITALDYYDNPATNFTGTVNLNATAGGAQATNFILGNITHSSSLSGNFTLGYSFTPSTNLTVTHVRRYFGAKISIWNNNGTLLASQNVTGANGVWTETALTNPVPLLAGTTYRVAAYASSGSYYWRQDGGFTFPYGSLGQSCEASGDAFPASSSSPSVRWWFVDLRYTVGTTVSGLISPTVSGPFVNGIWTGNLTALAPATNLTIRADDGAAHAGNSAAMMVELRNDLALKVEDTPDPVSVGGNLNYLVTITNVGPASATGVVLSNQLPTGVTLTSVAASQGSITTNGNVLVCALGNLTGNATASVTIGVRANTAGTLTNRASVHRGEADALLSNNSVEVATTVQFPVASINDVSVLEGNSGLTPLVFAVTVSPPPATNVSVSFVTTNVTALAGDDYLATNGVLNFVIGQTNQFFAVQVRGDTNTESAETFLALLSNPVNMTLGTAVGTGTIINDDTFGRVAIFGAPSTDVWNNDVALRISTAGNFSQVDPFLAKAGYPVPTLSQLQQYAAVLVFSDTSFNDNIALGDVLADYVDSGGGVVLATFGFYSSGGSAIQGRIKTGNYLPFTTGSASSGSTLTLVPDAPGHPLLDGVTVFNGGSSSFHNSSIGIANGATLVAHWSNGQPLVGANQFGNGRVVGLNFYPPSSGTGRTDFWQTNTHGGQLLANALAWASHAPPNTNPPTISHHPTNYVAFEGGFAEFSVSALGGFPRTYQWQRNGSNLTGQTNSTLTLFNVQMNDAGDYTVIVSNPYGYATSAIAVLTVNPLPPSAEFQILALLPSGSAVVDHSGLTGDDRGGIAASSSQVFYSGDTATARFSLANLSGAASIGRVNDAMVSDLRTEQLYHLGNGTNLLAGGGTVTSLVELNGSTGLPTGNVIPLSTQIVMGSGSGIFAGYGRIALHNGSRVYEVILPSGTVIDRGAMGMPGHTSTENWAFWGVVENLSGTLYLVYVQNPTTIARTQVPSGTTTTLASFSNLSDMACLTVSLTRNRWYFHYEGSGQFGGTSETVGYADATFSLVAPTNPPTIITQPFSQTATVGTNVSFTVSAVGGTPMRYQWRKESVPLVGATNATYMISSVQYSNAGNYSVVVSNAYGQVVSSNATLSVVAFSTNISLAAFDQGWYDISGFHGPANANYFVGDLDAASTPLRDWFAFNIPPLPAPVGAAQLIVNTYGISSPTGSETYQLRHVSTPVPTLVAGGSGLTPVFNDLGDGAIYGSRVFSTSEANQFIAISLNDAFLTNIMAAAGQAFALGGELTTLDGTPGNLECIFGGSLGNPNDVRLSLTLISNPSPLKFVSTDIVGGHVRSLLGTVDGSPISSNRAANIQFYFSTNLSLSMNNWPQLTNNAVLTNGLLRIETPMLTNSPSQFLRAREVP